MAGPLTWRNVDAPDFRSSMQGYQMFSDMLGKAFSGAQEGLAQFDGTLTEEANKSLMMELAKYQDPEAAKAALANGTMLGDVDPRRISAATIQAAMGRPTDLLRQQALELGNEHTGVQIEDLKGDVADEVYTRGRTKSQNEASDRFAPFLAELAAAGGDLAKQRAITSRPEYQAALGALKASEIIDSAAFARDEAMFPLEYEGKRLNNEQTGVQTQGMRQDQSQSAWRFENIEKANEADRRAAAALEVQIRAMGGDTLEAEALIHSSGASDMVKALVYDKLQGVYQGLGGPISIGDGSTVPIAMDQAKTSVAQTLATTLPAPVVAGFMGNFEVEGGYTGALGDGGSASGIAQWRGERRQNFKNMFGKEPHQASPAEQAKFVQWEMQNPEKAGMTRAQRDAIMRAKTPQEAAALIDQFYERSNGKHRDRRVAAAGGFDMNTFGANPARDAVLDVELARQQKNAKSIAGKIIKQGAEGGDKTINDIVVELRNKLPKDEKGRQTSEDYLFNLVNEIDRRAGGKLNPAQIGVIIEDSITNADKSFWGPLNRLLSGERNLPGNRRIDSRKVQERIEQYTSGDILRQATNDERLQSGQAAIEAEAIKHSALSQELQRAEAMAQRSPKAKGMAVRLRDQVAASRTRLDNLLRQQQAFDENKFVTKNPKKSNAAVDRTGQKPIPGITNRANGILDFYNMK